MNMKSAFLRIEIFSFVMLPGILIAKPGPGNGCRRSISFGKDNYAPSFLTSSLNKNLSGSIRLKFIFFGKPPTL